MSLHLEPLPTATGRGLWPKPAHPAVAGASGLEQKLLPTAGQSRPPQALYVHLPARQRSLSLQATVTEPVPLDFFILFEMSHLLNALLAVPVQG